MYGRGTIFIFISCVLAIFQLDIGSQDRIGSDKHEAPKSLALQTMIKHSRLRGTR